MPAGCLFLDLLPSPGRTSGSSSLHCASRGPVGSLARLAKQHHAYHTISLENKTMIYTREDSLQTVLHGQIPEL